jgi:hypothetical protein
VHVQPPSPVDLDEVERETLAEHVRPVARDPVGRRVDGHPPLAAERELDDQSIGSKAGHRSISRPAA